jgi:hypothetical protein
MSKGERQPINFQVGYCCDALVSLLNQTLNSANCSFPRSRSLITPEITAMKSYVFKRPLSTHRHPDSQPTTHSDRSLSPELPVAAQLSPTNSPKLTDDPASASPRVSPGLCVIRHSYILNSEHNQHQRICLSRLQQTESQLSSKVIGSPGPSLYYRNYNFH